jgi:hypothetical protein
LVEVHAYSNQLPVTFRLEKLLSDAVTHHRSHPGPPQRTDQRVERRLGRHMILRIIDDYKEGTDTTRLAERYKIGKGTLLRLLR